MWAVEDGGYWAWELLREEGRLLLEQACQGDQEGVGAETRLGEIRDLLSSLRTGRDE